MQNSSIQVDVLPLKAGCLRGSQPCPEECMDQDIVGMMWTDARPFFFLTCMETEPLPLEPGDDAVG